MEDYKGKDPLAEWCAKEMKLDIDGKELVIKPTMKHYRELKALMKDSNSSEEKVNKQKEVLKDILKTTFPNSESVDDFIERYENKFQLALYAEILGISPDALKKKFSEALGKQAEN